MISSKIIFELKPDIKNHIIEGNFKEDDWEKLKSFKAYANDLASTSIIRNQKGSSLNVKYNHKKGMSISTEIPTDDELASFFHRLRPFILNREKTYFLKICNIISRCYNSQNINSLLKFFKEYFSGKYSQNFFKISTNDILINSEKLLKTWLNAYEYHHDVNKINYLNQIHSIFPLEGSKSIFIMLLIDKSKAIIFVTGFLNLILGYIKEVNFELSQQKTITITST